jgi:hypothetical protein
MVQLHASVLSPEGALCNPIGEPSRPLTCGSGPKGIRTPDLLAASQALYQLSYGPAGWSVYPDDIASDPFHGTSGASRQSRSRS